MSISEVPGTDIAADINTEGQLNVFGYVYGYISVGDTDWYRAWLEAGPSPCDDGLRAGILPAAR